MKGCSQRNMGETYHGVSQLSHREAGYKKFRAAASVAARELPSVTAPPQEQAHAPLCLFASLPDIIAAISIFSSLPGISLWSLLS